MNSLLRYCIVEVLFKIPFFFNVKSCKKMVKNDTFLKQLAHYTIFSDSQL